MDKPLVSASLSRVGSDPHASVVGVKWLVLLVDRAHEVLAAMSERAQSRPETARGQGRRFRVTYRCKNSAGDVFNVLETTFFDDTTCPYVRHPERPVLTDALTSESCRRRGQPVRT